MTAATQISRTFGVEIEVILPATYGPTKLAQVVSRRSGVTVQAQSYNHSAQPVWKIVRDGSVRGVRPGCEVVSPVLTGEAGLQEMVRVMRAIESTGASVNVTCGLHVHIYAGDLSLAQMKNLVKNYINFEDFFDHIQPASRRANNNIYIRSNRAHFGSYELTSTTAAFQAIDACQTLEQLMQTVCQGSRYYKLNLMAFRRHGTVEFRQHSGTVEADKAANWVRLLMAFVAGSINGRPRARTRADLTPARSFYEFFEMFRCKELRAYFAERRKALIEADATRAARTTPRAA